MERGSDKLALVLGVSALAFVTLSSCDRREAPEPEPTPTEGQRSIFQPEFQVESEMEPELMPALETVIRFPEGSELNERALAELATVLESPQVESGRPIVLRGHSDAGGSDEANMRASRTRAENVRDWLIENGIAEDRITVIAFGEQNPIEPNALPDGSPNEDGRAANRRVAIFIPGETNETDEPGDEGEATLIETLTSPTPSPAPSTTSTED